MTVQERGLSLGQQLQPLITRELAGIAAIEIAIAHETAPDYVLMFRDAKNSKQANVEQLATLLRMRGDVPAAISTYEAMIDLAPAAALGYAGLARTLTATADAGRAAETLGYAEQFLEDTRSLRLDVALAGASLAIRTTLRATGARAVPVAFGWHPYFRIPDLPRSDWELELPARRRLRLDAKLLPTGETEPAPALRGRLGDTVHDDLYGGLGRAPVFALSGGGRRIEVAFGEAYGFAIVYAPANDESEFAKSIALVSHSRASLRSVTMNSWLARRSGYATSKPAARSRAIR